MISSKAKCTCAMKPDAGVVNSAARRKPKKAVQQAAHSMASLKTAKFRCSLIIERTNSVIGIFSFFALFTCRLTAFVTRGRRRLPNNGSGNPLSTCNALTADKYTLIVDALHDLLKCPTKRSNVSSEIGKSYPFGIPIFCTVTNSRNARWADLYDLFVDAARAFFSNCCHSWSKEGTRAAVEKPLVLLSSWNPQLGQHQRMPEN